MMPQLNDFLEQSGMSLPEALVKSDEAKPKALATAKPVIQTKPNPKPTPKTQTPPTSEGEKE